MTFAGEDTKGRALEWLKGLKECLQGKTWFIHAGVLLGAVRGGDFIDWDVDIDVMMHRRHEDDFQELVKCLRERGYRASYIVTRDDRPEIKEIQHFVQAYYKGIPGHIGVRTERSWKGRGYFKTGTVMLRGVEFPCPGNVEQFLIEKYGPDWRTPKPPASWGKLSSRVERPGHPVPKGAWHD